MSSHYRGYFKLKEVNLILLCLNGHETEELFVDLQITISFTCHRNNFLKDPFKAENMKTIRQVESSRISLLDISTLSVPPSSLRPALICVCCIVFILSTYVVFILISIHVIYPSSLESGFDSLIQRYLMLSTSTLITDCPFLGSLF